MARYRITGPDGSTYEINAPDDATEQDVLAYAQTQFGGQQQQQAAPDVAEPVAPAPAAEPQRAPYSSFGEAAIGAGKALGTGLFKGAVGLGTLPGNMEALGRAGINRAAGMVGVEPPLSPETLNPVTYSNLMGRLENKFGKTYEPKTRAEKYIQAVGEFAPGGGLAGGISKGARAAQIVAPAFASESAGQLAEGTDYEVAARVGGALLGGTVANLGARTVTPAPITDPVKAAHVAELQKQGVKTLTAGQKTGSSGIRALEDASMNMPGGGRGRQMQVQQLEEFTSAALSKAGIQGQTRATPEVIEGGFNALGKQYEQVGQVAKVVADPGFGVRLKKVIDEYNQVTPSSQRVPIIAGLASDIRAAASKPGGMTGKEYLGFRSQMRRAQRGMGANPQASQALGNLIERLDHQMVRSAPKNIRADVSKYMRELNERYRNLLAIEGAANKAGEKSAVGLLSPQQLNAELKKQSKRITSRNSRELGRLAAAGDDVLRDLKSSGTAERTQAMGVIKSPATAMSAIASGALTAGDPFYMLAGAAAPLAIQAAAARGVTNPLLQKILANQLIKGRVNPEASRSVGFGMAPYLSQEYGE
jgi:hypothetical protein